MSKILVIEDNPDIHALLKESLEKDGYQVASAYSGTEADLLLKDQAFDLILLDLMLPGLTGEELLLKIREKSQVPIIVMSAKDAIDSKVEVLKSGADDYMVKPFDLKEVLARIQVQLKRREREAYQAGARVHVVGGLAYDPVNQLLTYQDQELDLTRQEARILALFLQHPKKIFTKQEIYEAAWDDFYMGEDKTINVHVSNIRKKLSQQTGFAWIETVWGVGFRLETGHLSKN